MSENYIFISYSHKNEISYYVNLLQGAGYNIIYDNSISFGEEWDLKVRKQLSSARCKGLLLFLTEDSAISSPILTELEYAKKYNKPYAAVVLTNDTPTKIFQHWHKHGDENERFISQEIANYFPKNQLYIDRNSFSFEQGSKIVHTFKEWGMESADSDFTASTYTSDISGEKERLVRQANGYVEFDAEAINIALDSIDGDNLVVLDLGCSNGFVTYSRFNNISRISKVIGIDYNEKDIEEANNEYAGNSKFSFYHLNIDDREFIPRLKEILSRNNVSSIDLVLGTFIFQHLKNPKLALLKLFDVLSPQGKVIIRESDDGCKIGYPNDELMLEIINRTNKFIKSSDRCYGRKLYSVLNELGYENIKVLYSTNDTIGKSRKEKEWLFNMGFSFRLNRLQSIYAENPNNIILREEIEWLQKALEKLKETFFSYNSYYVVTAFIAIASV